MHPVQSWLPPQCRAGDISLKIIAKKLVLKHKGTIPTNPQVSPKGKVRAIFKLLKSEIFQRHYWRRLSLRRSVKTYRNNC